MFNCSNLILAFHDQNVTLGQSEQTEMRDRRNANRDRLKRGMRAAGKPTPVEFVSQGSYSMKTMVQHPRKDYDIDDGVYFDKGDLVGERGGEMTALQVRQMVRDAIDDGSFATRPEVHSNCVRVIYKAGYHVDIPIYRRSNLSNGWELPRYQYERASDTWRITKAREVTAWFDRENTSQSPDEVDGRQMRRITRMIKKFARSRSSWPAQILSGFAITKLVTETYCPIVDRDDISLYSTLVAISKRLTTNTIINHPVNLSEFITKGQDDARCRFFREKVEEGIANLAPLVALNCTSDQAMKAWDKFFSVTFFSESYSGRSDVGESLLRTATVAPVANPYSFGNTKRVDNKPRGFA